MVCAPCTGHCRAATGRSRPTQPQRRPAASYSLTLAGRAWVWRGDQSSSTHGQSVRLQHPPPPTPAQTHRRRRAASMLPEAASCVLGARALEDTGRPQCCPPASACEQPRPS